VLKRQKGIDAILSIKGFIFYFAYCGATVRLKKLMYPEELLQRTSANANFLFAAS
jgi:hypothetical protein